MCIYLALLSKTKNHFEKESITRNFMIEIIISQFEKRISHLDAINEMAIYPNEELLWNENAIPPDDYNGII